MSSINKIPDNSANVINLNAVNPLAPIAPVTPSTQATQVEDVAAKKPTVNLFDQSTYQTQTSVSLADGSVITLPSMSTEDAAQAQAIFANVPAEKQAAVNEASSTLGRALMASGSSSSASALTVNQASPDVAAAAANASTVYSNSTTPSYGSNSGATNYDNTVQAVAYMGVLGLQNELGTYAQGMQATQATQNTLRTDQSELTTAVASWPDDATSTQSFTWHEVDNDGNVVAKSGDLNKAQAQAALSNVQSGLSSFTDQNQLQAMQLQNMTQNYQNGINTISNLMKAAYDTTKNTIGNIHY